MSFLHTRTLIYRLCYYNRLADICTGRKGCRHGLPVFLSLVDTLTYYLSVKPTPMCIRFGKTPRPLATETPSICPATMRSHPKQSPCSNIKSRTAIDPLRIRSIQTTTRDDSKTAREGPMSRYTLDPVQTLNQITRVDRSCFGIGPGLWAWQIRMDVARPIVSIVATTAPPIETGTLSARV